jgi:hypothetical protein
MNTRICMACGKEYIQKKIFFLETLCKSCHQKEHLIHCPKTGQFIGSR